MDVYLIPVGPDRYELYCEQPFARDNPAIPPAGVLGQIKHRVEDWLRRAEQWEPPAPGGPPRTWLARLQDRAMALVAERVAEQRLLWNLRRESSVTVAHPDDQPFADTKAAVQRLLQQDHDRHQYWVWVDGVLFVLTFVLLGPLFLLIPGVANLPAIYFGFRAVGHWYSRRGARHGLREVRWAGRPCGPLTELRGIPLLPVESREAHVQEIATQLRLQHLAAFYERAANTSL